MMYDILVDPGLRVFYVPTGYILRTVHPWTSRQMQPHERHTLSQYRFLHPLPMALWHDRYALLCPMPSMPVMLWRAVSAHARVHGWRKAWQQHHELLELAYISHVLTFVNLHRPLCAGLSPRYSPMPVIDQHGTLLSHLRFRAQP